MISSRNIILPIIGAFVTSGCSKEPVSPNVVFVLADEWRAMSTGYTGNEDVLTPNLDDLAKHSLVFSNAISCCPVSCPYRGSLLTGQYPLTTGVFVNDVQLDPSATSLGKTFREAGYSTAYIGKWHLDGHGRSSFIPADRRQGFEYWKALECTHDYFNSLYWDTNDSKNRWEGYDAFAQTADAMKFIREGKDRRNPFLLFLSWGPPHTPFGTAPVTFRKKYADKSLKIPENVPGKLIQEAIADLEGYYGHISALDSCIGLLQNVLRETGMYENTVFIFTSDHGAMVRSHGRSHKQLPYEESINVPLIISYPGLLGSGGRKTDMLINTPDLMPTLLGLCGLPVPASVEGTDKTPVILDREKDSTDAVLIACYQPFGQWSRKNGGREYRGVRTIRYTYAKDLNGPWLLFDNLEDRYQVNNLVNLPEYSGVVNELDIKLAQLLRKTNDAFLPGMEYIRKWGYLVDETETVPYAKVNYQGLPVN